MSDNTRNRPASFTRAFPPPAESFKDLGPTKLARRHQLTDRQTYGHWCSRCEGIWFGHALARIIHEKCAVKAKPLISFTTMRMGCLMKFFAMKSLAQVFGGLGRFRAVR